MSFQNEINQFNDLASKELEVLLEVRAAYQSSRDRKIASMSANMDDTILSFLERTCNAPWISGWISSHPVSAILFLNRVYEELEGSPSWNAMNRCIQMSTLYKELQQTRSKDCARLLDVQSIPDQDLRALAVMRYLDVPSTSVEDGTFLISGQFKTAAGDFRTIKQLMDVRDEARRILISRSLIAHDFKTRATATALGCKSDGALADNVRVLFGTPDFKRETIEPIIRGWIPPTSHPFQAVIDDLVAFKKLPKVEAQIQELYPPIIMRAAEKCQFVKVRMAEELQVSEKTVTSLLSGSKMDGWYARSQKEFLRKACEAVGYNYSQVATLLNVDVRYVTQLVTGYQIEKPEGTSQVGLSSWPTSFSR